MSDKDNQSDSGSSEKKDGGKDNKPPEDERCPPTALGWTVRILSVGILLAIAAALIYELMQPSGPAGITIEPKWEDVRTSEASGQVLVPVKITNTGEKTIRNLTIDFPNAPDGASIEVELLGSQETMTAVVGYDSRPDTVDFKIKTFEQP